MSLVVGLPSSKITIRSVRLLLLCFFIILKPFYLFSSGLPQISDLVIVLIFLTFSKTNIHVSLRELLLFLFSFLVVVTNLYWALAFSDISPVIFILFYVFNVLFFIFSIRLFDLLETSEFKVLQKALLVALLLQFCLSFFIIDSGVRQTIMFNNPNQLGYWGLCNLILSYLVFMRTGSKFLYILSVLFCLYLISISLSKAAIVAALMFLVFSNLNIKRFFVLTLFSISLGVILSNYIEELRVVNQVIKRVSTIGESNDDNAEGRGYDRIYKYPNHLLFGAGEGVPHAFIEKHDIPPELHSSLGTVLFSYGIIGLLLIGGFFFYIFVKSFPIGAYAMLPLFAYSLTHQGLRSTVFWLILALLVSFTRFLRNKKGLRNRCS